MLAHYEKSRAPGPQCSRIDVQCYQLSLLRTLLEPLLAKTNMEGRGSGTDRNVLTGTSLMVPQPSTRGKRSQTKATCWKVKGAGVCK